MEVKIHTFTFVYDEKTCTIEVYENRDLVDTFYGNLPMGYDTFFNWCCNWYRNIAV